MTWRSTRSVTPLRVILLGWSLQRANCKGPEGLLHAGRPYCCLLPSLRTKTDKVVLLCNEVLTTPDLQAAYNSPILGVLQGEHMHALVQQVPLQSKLHGKLALNRNDRVALQDSLQSTVPFTSMQLHQQIQLNSQISAAVKFVWMSFQF